MPKRAVAPEDLLQIRIPSDPRLSPDGKSLVFCLKEIVANKYETNLWLRREGSARRITGSGSDRAPRWKPDGSGIAFASGREKPRSQIFWLDLSGGEARALTNLPEGSLGEFVWSPDGKSIAFTFRELASDRTTRAESERAAKNFSTPPRIVETLNWRLDGDGVYGDDRFRVYILDVESGKHRLFFDRSAEDSYTFAWTHDSSGLIIAYNRAKNPEMEPDDFGIDIVDVKTGKARSLKGLPMGRYGRPSLDSSGERIAVYYEDRTRDKYGTKNAAICIYATKSGDFRNLTAKSDLNVTPLVLSDLRDAVEVGPIWTSVGESILFTLSALGCSRICSVSVERGKVDYLTPDGMECLLGSAVGENVACVTTGPASLPEILSTNGGREEYRSTFNKKIEDQLFLSVAEEHWVESERGVRIQTWVLKPRGFRAGKKYAAVLQVHGGPHAMYSSSVFLQSQVLASNGYVVAFCNPRGSTGYGEKFARWIMGDWGNKDWKDVLAVTKFVKSLKFVDSKRVAIMGGSYGGYMVNWAIGHGSDYKCAISDRSVSNLLSKSGNSDYVFVPDGSWPGAAYGKWETLWEKSPVKHFGKAKTPTLVIHSEGDMRCNIEQGDQVYTFLKMQGVPCRYVRYPASTSHGLSRNGPPDLRIHRMREQLRWFSEYL
jgi:dipeptidyl aminopeptidase/acylaminoacyl peptidase